MSAPCSTPVKREAIASDLSPTVAYRLGAWLASRPGRTWECLDDEQGRELIVSLYQLPDSEDVSECVGAGAGIDIDAAVLAALDEVNGGNDGA